MKIIGNYQLNHMNVEAKDLVSIKGFMTFSTFVEFVIHEAENEKPSFDAISNYSPHSVHWWPYTELCGVCKIRYDLIAHMETFDEDVYKLISRFPDILDFRLKDIKGYEQDTNILTAHQISIAGYACDISRICDILHIAH